MRGFTKSERSGIFVTLLDFGPRYGSSLSHMWRSLGFLVTLGVACSGESDERAASLGKFLPDAAIADSGAPDAMPAVDAQGPHCPPPLAPSDDTPRRINSASAALRDLNGDDPGTITVSVCGTDLCVFGNALPGGDILVEPGLEIRRPALSVGRGLDFAKLLVPLVNLDTDVGEVTVLKIPPASVGAVLGSGTVMSGDVRLELPDDVEITIDKLTYTPEEQKFRAVALPASAIQGYPPADLTPRLVIAVSPSDTRFCPAASLDLSNVAGLPAGAAVELWLQGTSAIEEFAPYGQWKQIAEGTVDALAKRITFKNNVPVLGLFFVRLAQ